jgi:hypothetical protein
LRFIERSNGYLNWRRYPVRTCDQALQISAKQRQKMAITTAKMERQGAAIFTQPHSASKVGSEKGAGSIPAAFTAGLVDSYAA